MITLIISNEEMNDTMEIDKSFGKPGLLMKGVSETIKNERKGRKSRFLTMLLCTLGVSLLGNLLTGKGVKPKTPKHGVIGAGRRTIRAGQPF